MEKITLKDFENQWKILFQRDNACHNKTEEETTTPSSSAEELEDPFDCSALAIPPNHVLVDRIADEYVDRWKELDERKVAAIDRQGTDNASALSAGERSESHQHHLEVNENGDEDQHERSESTKRNKKRKRKSSLPPWYDRHVRLPEQFDYATKQTSPPPDDGTGDRVISLEDPTSTLSYHTELWKLFREIPTDRQLEGKAVSGSNLPNTKHIYDEINEARQSNNNLDAHALSRFRMNDRHDLLPPLPSTTSHNRNQRAPASSSMHDFCATLRLEFLRQQMRRTSTPDSYRMVLEFLGSQTLLDVHRAIAELTEDDLWDEAEKLKSSSTTTTDSNQQQTMETSGFFFIEGTFYTAGEVDYTTPILQWMKTGNEREQKSRLKTHLGLTVFDSLPPVRSMADTRLEDISCRLGMRYVHVMHGDVECAVFATDRRLMTKTAAQNLHFPILHDLWTPSYNLPECDACQARPGSIATATNCAVTGGHRILCQDCCRKLRLPSQARDQIQRFAVWRGQADLSAGATPDTTF